MDLLEFQAQMQRAVQACRGLLPEADLNDMAKLVELGNPGLALRNLWVQSFEHGASLSVDLLRELQSLSASTGLATSYWHQLSPLRLWVDDQPISPQLVTFNDGLNYGRFYGVDAGLSSVRLFVERADLVRRFSKTFNAVSEELRIDDETYGDDSPFTGLRYAPLAAAFEQPEKLAEALRFLDRDIFAIYIGHFDDCRFVLNSTDTINVSPQGVSFEGKALVMKSSWC